jgi:hypothetical protein
VVHHPLLAYKMGRAVGMYIRDIAWALHFPHPFGARVEASTSLMLLYPVSVDTGRGASPEMPRQAIDGAREKFARVHR